MAAAGLGMTAFIETRHALKWRRGVLKGITAICSATAAAGLQLAAAATAAEWLAPAAFAAALPAAAIITAGSLKEIRKSRCDRRWAAKADRKLKTRQSNRTKKKPAKA